MLWRAEQLQNAGADLDEPQRRSIQKWRVTEEQAAERVTGDKNEEHAKQRLHGLMEFLFQRPDELTDEELEVRNGLMADERLASLLRIYQPGVWYLPFCDYLREYVLPKFNPVKRSRARKKGNKGKRGGEGKFIKILVDPVMGTKTAVTVKRNTGQRKSPRSRDQKQ